MKGERKVWGDSHLIVVDADEEEEGGVAPVHDLVVPVLHERALHQHKTTAHVSETRNLIPIQIQEGAHTLLAIWAQDSRLDWR